MSSETENARAIAERIARKVGSTKVSPVQGAPLDLSTDLAAVRAGLNDLERKLAQLEAKVTNQPASTQASAPARSDRGVPPTHSPWLAGVNAMAAHPSQERFGVEEAAVSELVDFFEKEKQCTMEPGGKPCDHCSMCSSRGF